MSSASTSGNRTRSIEQDEHLDALCDRFEQACKAGGRPILEAYLAELPESDHSAAAWELLRVEAHYRRQAGEEPHLAEYESRLPMLAVRDMARALAPPPAAVDVPTRRGGQSDSSETPDQMAGQLPVVPGYEILGVIGRGGMGVVYRAQNTNLDRAVALKLLRPECSKSAEALERFRREARTASSLNHPNIGTVYEFDEHLGQPYLAMELVEGQTLRALADKPMPLMTLIPLIQQVARALGVAHAAGIVHRDIKPENLVVRPDGLVKVLDFGLARLLPANTTQFRIQSAGLTNPGTLIGTMRYMAPEQARCEPAGAAADIFALGLILYELVVGRHPFPSESEYGVLHAIMMEEALSASRLRPEVPERLDALIKHMLTKNAFLRPTAVEVEAALAELTDTNLARSGTPPAAPVRRPTVGRVQERALLHDAFESASAGRGSLVCVTGEPGMGKSTLVEEFLEELATRNQNWGHARGYCSERLAGAEAYLPFLEALDSLLKGDGGSSAAQVMKVLAPTWYAQLTPLAVDDSFARILEESKGSSQERWKRELGVYLEEMSRRRPLIMFLDDVHWADPSSVDLLSYLGTKCVGLRLLLIISYRPSDLMRHRHPFGPIKLELQGRGVCSEISLPFLNLDDLRTYLELAFAGHHFPQELAAILHARTEGNPLFMVDLLRDMTNHGAIAIDHGHWKLMRAMPDLQRELPQSVRSMIQRKVDQLSELDRQLLMAASVQGPQFDSAVVARMLGRDAADVEERLDVLQRVHALVRLAREHAFPNAILSLRYSFVHVLYQNTLDGLLLPTRKATWSGVAAQALLEFHAGKETTVAAELALLFEAARQPARAIEHFLAAARNAIRVFAHHEAIGLARRGLALVEKLSESPGRDQQELALLLSLGVPLVATQGFASPEVEQTYNRARELCLRASDIETLFPVLYGLWNVCLLRCELTRCKDLAGQMYDLAQIQPDPVLLLQAHNVLQQPMLHMGDFAGARLRQEQCLALYDLKKHHALTAVYGEDPGVGCLTYGAVTLWCLGYPEQAVRSVQAARRLAEEQSSPFNVARALYFGAFTHMCRREYEPTQILANALLELSNEQGFALLIQGSMILLGWCDSEQGEVVEGIAKMRQGLAGWQATGALSHRPYQLALLAEALARVGRGLDGLDALTEALSLATNSGERFLEAELLRLRGMLLLECGGVGSSKWGEAEASFNEALGVARRQQAKSLELRAAMSLSRLYRSQGRIAEGQSLLAETYGWFTEGFDTRDLREANALLEVRA